jgi:hypothetical protein
MAWLYSFFATLTLLWFSTGLKWLLHKYNLNHSLWKQEQDLAVIKNHLFAANEAQLAGQDFEKSLMKDEGSTTTFAQAPESTTVRHLSLFGNRTNGNVDSKAARDDDGAVTKV